MNNKERNCDYMTMVSTGERPDAEIHLVAFEENGGIQVHGKKSGNMRTLAMLTTSMIEQYCKEIREEQGLVPTAAFVSAVIATLAATVGKDALYMALFMNDPEEMAKAMTKMLENMKGDDD